MNLLSKRLRVISVFLVLLITLYTSQPIITSLEQHIATQARIKNSEYIVGENKQIIENKNYVDPKVRKVNLGQSGSLGIVPAEHPMGTGLDPLDPITPVDRHLKPEEQKSQEPLILNSDYIEKTKKEKKDNAQILDERNVEYTADNGAKIVSQTPVDKYKKIGEEFVEIDLKPKKDKDNNFVNISDKLNVKYSESLSDGITVNTPSGDLTFTPHDANGVIAETEDNRVIYNNAWEGVDLVYEYVGNAVKEYIFINEQIEVPSFTFSISGGSLSYSEDIKGGLEVTLESGDKIFINPVGVGTQLLGPVHADVIKQEIGEDHTIKITLDAEWLKSLSEEHFPIVIDPTVTRYIESSGNAYHSYKNNVYDCNYTLCDINTGSVQHDNQNWFWRSRIKFDLSVLNGKQLLGSNLYIAKSYSGRPSGSEYTNVQIKVAWASCYGFDCIGGSPVASTYMTTYGNIDVTSVLQWMMDNNQTGGWLIIWGEENGNYTFKGLDPYNMQLDFAYNNIPTNPTIASPQNTQVITNANPILRINPSTDADNDDRIEYNFVLSNSLGTIVQQSGWTKSLSMAVVDGVLQDDQIYTWKVYVKDQYYYPSSPGVTATFKLESRLGKDITQSYNEAGPFAVSLATGNAYTTNSSHSMNALGGNIGIGLEYNSPVLAREGLSAKYWNNSSFSGDPVYNRVDPNVDFNWGASSPYKGIIPVDFFAVSWRGYLVAPTTGNYKFGTKGDNNVWFYGNWNFLFHGPCCGETWSNDIYLTEGQLYPIQIDYTEGDGDAFIEFKVQLPDATTKIVPSEYLRTEALPTALNNGLTGKYYFDSGDHSFSTNKSRFLLRNEPVINFDWVNGGPAVGTPIDNFLVNYEGYITAPLTGDYKIGIEADDGVIVRLDDQTIIDEWTGGVHNVESTTINLVAGEPYKIEIDYFELTGNAKLILKWSGPMTMTNEMIVIENKFLSPEPLVLPVGWKLTLDATGNIPFESLKVRTNGDVVMKASDGTESLYTFTNDGAESLDTFTNGGYKPPVNEDGWLVKNSDNTYTFTDTLGSIYIYDFLDNSGYYKLRESSSPYDDKNPAGLKYEYTTIGGIPKLRKIIDGVDNNRYGQLYYQGESQCANVSGDNAIPAGYLCAFGTTDGRWTRFYYYQKKLTRIEYPGTDAFYDYGYYSDGKINALRDTAMIDSIIGGLRDYNETGSRYEFNYDPIGRMNTIYFPSNDGASDLQHTLEYFPTSSKQHLVGSVEPHGYSKYLEFDNLYRTTKLCDAMALCVLTEWDAVKDLVLSTTGPTGLKSTTIYDADDKPLESYGPAPSTWFGSDRKPLSQYLTQVPRVETKYEENFTGGAVAFYQVAGDNLFGSPKLHQFGIDKNSPSVIGFNYVSQTFPITKDTGMDGVGLSLTGKITFPQDGTYTFKTNHTDGIRLFVDDQLIADNWTNRSSSQVQKIGTFNATANKVYRVRLDWATFNATPSLSALLSGPGVSESNIWSSLKPGYNLPTTNIVYDQQLGNVETKTNYQDPAYGLVSSNVLDPTGLNYSSSASYEAQGTGYFRQLTKTSPGGTVTNYNYYGATEQVDNICTSTNDSVSQAGFVKSKLEAQESLGQNLILNPSAETADGANPMNWYTSSWGTNSTTFEYSNTGYSGSRSLKVSMSSFTNGDAEWMHDPVTVTPGTTLTYSNTYKSNVPTTLYAMYKVGESSYSFSYLASLPTSNTWTTTGVSMVVPANASQVTVYHLISSVGELSIDNVSLTQFNPSIQSGQAIELIYDSTGRVIADRLNLENWNCTTYDSRGRVESKVIANNNGKTGKTITNNYLYGGSPLKKLTTDGSTTVISEYDFVGNLVKYTDSFGAVTTYTYDSQNRLIKKESDVGKEEWEYNDYSQIIQKEFNDVVYANVTYDSFGRVSGITYPQAQQLAYLGTTRDALDRPIKYSWKQSDGKLIDEELTKSQSGLILSQKFTHDGTVNNQTYTFDKADRLTAADYGDRQYAYNYNTATSCSFQNSNKNFNRTSDSVTIGGVTTTNNYCYDKADRLQSSTQFGTPVYDSRGNTTQLGVVAFGYDILDQNINISETGKSLTYTRDVLGRIINSNYNSGAEVSKYNFSSNSSSPDILRDNNNNIVERYVSLPGLRLTVKSSGNEYSIMSSTGNVLAKNTGTLKRYDPFGTQIGGTDTLGFGGSQLRETDYRFSVDFIQMGARVYIPVLGRFLQVDPVDGGTQNDYVYPVDPINTSDFSGSAILVGVPIAALVAGAIVLGALALPKISGSLDNIKITGLSIGGQTYLLLDPTAQARRNLETAMAQNQTGAGSVPGCDTSIKNCGNYKNQSKDELERSRRSFEKRITEHLDKIRNPQIDPSRVLGDPTKYREGLIRSWEKEIGKFQREIDKINDLLKIFQ